MSHKQSRAGRLPEWETPEGRVVWLLEKRFGGNRSAMARAVGFSNQSHLAFHVGRLLGASPKALRREAGR